MAGMLSLAILLWPSMSAESAEQNKISLSQLTQETQKTSEDPSSLTLAWWIPEEFWKVALVEGGLTSAQVEDFVKVLRPYTLVIVVDGTMGPIGGATFKTEDQVRSTLRVKDSQGNQYDALPTAEFNADLSNLVAVMKPMLQNLMGQMGQHMYIFAFPGKAKDGRAMADPKEKGSFAVVLDGKEYKWRLPLGALLPPKTCPTCKEKLNGAYSFCPWDGQKLN